MEKVKVYCRQCIHRGKRYSVSWEWCEFSYKNSFTEVKDRVPAIRKEAKNSEGLCKDYEEERKKAWWKILLDH